MESGSDPALLGIVKEHGLVGILFLAVSEITSCFLTSGAGYQGMLFS